MIAGVIVEKDNSRLKPLFRSFLSLSLLVSASLACKAVTKLFAVETPEAYIPEAFVTQEVIAEPDLAVPACPSVTGAILEEATQFYEVDSGEKTGEEPEQIYLVTYSVSGDQISAPFYEDVPADLAGLQEDILGHKQIWEYYTTLIPSEQRSSLAEYSIVTDGEGNILAAVTQTAYDPALWALEVDIRDSDDKRNLTFTLIHEFAHLLTLGPKQVTPSQAVFNDPENDDVYNKEVNACPDYFPGEGCSLPDSYINTFFSEFWSDIHAEWQAINLIEDDDAYYEALDDFYLKYEDRFLTDYAATNPEEDIAEAFTFFVLSPSPNGDTIADDKILFFYRYTELVKLRNEILRKVCQLDP